MTAVSVGRSGLPTVVFTTILSFSALYAPQPLLPLLARQLAIDLPAASLLMTVVFVPLSIAPLAYGLLLGTVSPRRMLQVAVPLLALAQIPFLFASTYGVLLAARFVQGLLIPAILTALMTFTAQSRGELQRSMSIYIASTITGGFAGRAVSGALASWFGWRMPFLFLLFSLGIAFVLLLRLPDRGALTLLRPDPQRLLQLLANPHLRVFYTVVFCFFFAFAAMMNFLPFRLTELQEAASELRIGLAYSGYLLGVLTALGSSAICNRLGGELKTIRLGLLVYGLSLLGFLTGKVALLFVLMFLFCGAMFLVHSTCSSYLNRIGGSDKGMVNGLYVASYYFGGMLGSFLPGLIYRQFGWNVFVVSLTLIVCLALAMLWPLRTDSCR